jgi:hypothetical protein
MPHGRRTPGGFFGLCAFVGGEQAARDFDARGFRFRRTETPGRLIARDLLKLIAVDQHVGTGRGKRAAGQGAAPAERPKHGEHGGSRHQRYEEPERHALSASKVKLERPTGGPVTACQKGGGNEVTRR